jgi:hypothetical protein
MALKPRFPLWTVLIIATLAASSCRAKTVAPSGYPINTPFSGGAYPVSTPPPATQPETGYPVAPSPVTPNPEAASYTFTLDSIHAGDVHVTGTGPAQLPIRIADLSQGGVQIGVGLIDNTGRFDIAINPPAIGGYRIGVLLGDLSGTKYHIEDFGRVVGSRDIPLIGLVLTSTLTNK